MRMVFGQDDLLTALAGADDAALDALAFGVIGMDRTSVVTVYNANEAWFAGLSHGRVIGRHFFRDVAPCMNNYLVALRFEEESAIDAVIDYVFTLRMRPTPVRLRLLKGPETPTMYLVVERLVSP